MKRSPNVNNEVAQMNKTQDSILALEHDQTTLAQHKSPTFQDLDESFGSVFTNQTKDIDPASFSGAESKRDSLNQIEASSPKASSLDPTSTQPSSGIDDE